MCLLDEVVAWTDDAIHARSRSHRRADNPLRSDGRLRAVHLCEYGAQAMAVHGGLVARAAGGVAAPGFLVSLRAVELAVARIDDLPDALDVHAEKLLGERNGWQYAFRIEHAGIVLARGRAAVLAQRASSRRRANARTGNVPMPRTFGGTAEKRKPDAGNRIELAQMLDDRNAGAEQRRMHGPRAVGDVVDVERIDADEPRARVAQIRRRVGGQERMAFEILVGAPVLDPSRCARARPCRARRSPRTRCAGSRGRSCR